ncbi:Protein LATERAL ROOT PRIMORDIUM like [Actinidia chinensis var. chinensis]|uniref:Protein LATERAL ROOT PRIMORDIUM like n=1 Tax=Actinidia chinensis var. chinensis TaxID=1590841 RepID=A0A2R6P7Z9_ACTCC|nr:Protein LATERAL ROOT PRIMORDIUM like [Actinidia chinensis var. chinensis]
MWPPSAATTRYGEMGMVGLRDLFVVAPASSFHHHHHQEPLFSDIAASNTALGVGVIPLLTAAPLTAADEDIFNANRSRSSGIQVWQQNQQPQHPNYLKNPTPNLLQTGGGIGGPMASGAGATTCQDCGNQAKKDCTHRRCRTCCKSRGFDCATHVKSTWVPASRRRERQLMASAAVATAGSSGSTSGTKKPRLIASQTTTSHTSASNTPPKSFDTSSSHQDASFKEGLPGQVRAPAVFKCVRVTAVDDGEDEYAYQAVVKIGRHVFKGFLYDQGMEGREEFPNISELHLGGGGGGNGGGGGRNGASSNPIIDPSDVYAASGGGLLGGSSYGNQIN